MKAFLLCLACGLFSFLLGLRLMRQGLAKLFLPRLSLALKESTATPFRGFLAGVLFSFLLQGSSTLLVLTIGLVNSNLLSFRQTVGLILGANVGTCFTVQLVALEAGDLVLFLLLPGLFLLCAGEKWRAPGLVLTGVSLLLGGLAFMGHLKDFLPAFPFLLRALAGASQTFAALLAGLLAASFLQTSSVVVSLAAALYREGFISLDAAAGIVLGSNLGTCLTSVFASLGGNRASRAVALAHVLLNALGILFFYPLLPLFLAFVRLTTASPAQQVANVHLFFNLFSSLFLLPFAPHFASLVEKLTAKRGRVREKYKRRAGERGVAFWVGGAVGSCPTSSSGSSPRSSGSTTLWPPRAGEKSPPASVGTSCARQLSTPKGT